MSKTYYDSDVDMPAAERVRYEKVKSQAALVVDAWFRSEPGFWRDQGAMIHEACCDPFLASPIDGIRGHVDQASGEIKVGPFASPAQAMRAYYLALIVVHDASDGIERIMSWPEGVLPGRDGLVVSLESAAMSALDPEFGDKSAFLYQALDAVGSDLNTRGYSPGRWWEMVLANITSQSAVESATPLERALLEISWRRRAIGGGS